MNNKCYLNDIEVFLDFRVFIHRAYWAVKCLGIFSLLLPQANCCRLKKIRKDVAVYEIIMHLYIYYRLLLVGGCETDEDGVSKAAGCGISAWRILSGSPHYKQVTSYEDDVRTVSSSPHFTG